MAGTLGEHLCLRSNRGTRQAEVLLPRDVRIPIRARARRARPQLHDRGRCRPYEADARVQRPAPIRLGCVRPARRERRHQARHAPGKMDAREHRAHERAAPADRNQLRLGAGNCDLSPRVLPLEPVAVPQDARARPGVSPAFQCQLVPELQHRAGQRAGRRRRLLALWHHRHAAGARTVVLPHHPVRRRAARSHGPPHRLAGKSADDAAELDWEVGWRARAVPDRAAAGS